MAEWSVNNEPERYGYGACGLVWGTILAYEWSNWETP